MFPVKLIDLNLKWVDQEFPKDQDGLIRNAVDVAIFSSPPWKIETMSSLNKSEFKAILFVKISRSIYLFFATHYQGLCAVLCIWHINVSLIKLARLAT